jgi:hypothetical protein
MDLVSASKALPFTLMALLAPAVGSQLHAQDVATLRLAENVRAQPRGVILGRLLAGTTLPVVSREDLWVEIRMEGWIWTPSIQATDRLGFDLSVSATPQENLRAEPQGEILARLVTGTLLEELEEGTGWTRVGRTAWVWAESVGLDSGSPVTTPRAGAAGQDEGWWRSGGEGAPLLSAPDGDTLARAQPGAELQLLAREGNWVRVRLEGWVWAPAGEVADPTGQSAVAEITPGEVGLDPLAHRGRVVSWDLQFISLERAEKVRTDFYEGEPFLLARTSTSGSSFVYVAVPPDRLGELEGLIPLERIRVVGRIRTGAAALTGNPILDLLEFTRLSRD